LEALHGAGSISGGRAPRRPHWLLLEPLLPHVGVLHVCARLAARAALAGEAHMHAHLRHQLPQELQAAERRRRAERRAEEGERQREEQEARAAATELEQQVGSGTRTR
jgi:hypothetical protein